MRLVKAPWRLFLFVFLLTSGGDGLLGQNLLRTKGLCLFDTNSSPDDLYAFSSDVAMEARVDSLVGLAGLDRNFVVATANIPKAAAAIVAPNRMLLYSQEDFQETGNRATTNWNHLAVLCHQLSHLLLQHTLTTIPAERKREELEADQFAGTLLHAFGSTLDQSLIVYRSLPARGTARLYPSRAERLVAVEKGWRSLGDTIVTNFVTEAAVPSFPLPPPRPSAWKELPLGKLKAAHKGNITLGELGSQLQKAFARAGYNQLSFYSTAPQGFAIVTGVEQMTVDGSPKTEDRFSVKISAPRLFSLSSYLQALLGPSKGHFRIVAVVVSPMPLTYTPEPASLRHSIDWLWGGMTRLPDTIAKRPLTSEYTCTALVYEFVQPSAFTEAVLRVPGSLSAEEHLAKGGVWQNLQF